MFHCPEKVIESFLHFPTGDFAKELTSARGAANDKVGLIATGNKGSKRCIADGTECAATNDYLIRMCNAGSSISRIVATVYI